MVHKSTAHSVFQNLSQWGFFRCIVYPNPCMFYNSKLSSKILVTPTAAVAFWKKNGKYGTFQTKSFIFGECNKSHVQQRRKLWNYKSDSAVYLYHFDSWAQVFFSWAKLVNHLDIILRNLSPIDCDYIFYHCRDKCVLGDFCFSTILPSTLTEVTYQSDSDWL